jgi:hypothetical protein
VTAFVREIEDHNLLEILPEDHIPAGALERSAHVVAIRSITVTQALLENTDAETVSTAPHVGR